MKFSRSLGMLVMIFTISFAVACGGDKEANAPSGTENAAQSSGQSTNSAAALPEDPVAAVQQALENQQAAGAYRVKTTVEADASKMEMTAEIRMPDQMRVVTDLGEQKMEMVFVGDKGWMKMGDNWTDSPLKMNDLLQQMNTLGAEMIAEVASDVTKVGTETVDGQEAVLYTYNIDMNKSTSMKMDVQSAVKIWVRTSDNLPIRQEVVGEAMGMKSSTVQTIEYDPNIAVEAPVK